MAYNRGYFLERVIEIQDIVKREKKRGCFQKDIYENLIEKQYHISVSTFNNYLGLNARRELTKLKEQQLKVSQ